MHSTASISSLRRFPQLFCLSLTLSFTARSRCWLYGFSSSESFQLPLPQSNQQSYRSQATKTHYCSTFSQPPDPKFSLSSSSRFFSLHFAPAHQSVCLVKMGSISQEIPVNHAHTSITVYIAQTQQPALTAHNHSTYIPPNATYAQMPYQVVTHAKIQ